VLPTIAQTLGLLESGERQLEAALHDHLAGRRVLLVLDNFEQLLGAATTVGDLLGRSRDVQVVVTSRTRLRLAAEHAFPVSPLTVPDLRSLPAPRRSRATKRWRSFSSARGPSCRASR
jgi:predicted ATPase